MATIDTGTVKDPKIPQESILGAYSPQDELNQSTNASAPPPQEKTKQTATCHPDRPHLAKGLCKQCYNKQYKSDKRKPQEPTAKPVRPSEPQQVEAEVIEEPWTEEEMAFLATIGFGFVGTYREAPLAWKIDVTGPDGTKPCDKIGGRAAKVINKYGIGFAFKEEIQLALILVLTVNGCMLAEKLMKNLPPNTNINIPNMTDAAGNMDFDQLQTMLDMAKKMSGDHPSK